MTFLENGIAFQLPMEIGVAILILVVGTKAAKARVEINER
jgi:ABC-type nickel/cobalt efflux system permease component RcnA